LRATYDRIATGPFQYQEVQSWANLDWSGLSDLAVAGRIRSSPSPSMVATC